MKTLKLSDGELNVTFHYQPFHPLPSAPLPDTATDTKMFPQPVALGGQPTLRGPNAIRRM